MQPQQTVKDLNQEQGWNAGPAATGQFGSSAAVASEPTPSSIRAAPGGWDYPSVRVAVPPTHSQVEPGRPSSQEMTSTLGIVSGGGYPPTASVPSLGSSVPQVTSPWRRQRQQSWNQSDRQPVTGAVEWDTGPPPTQGPDAESFPHPAAVPGHIAAPPVSSYPPVTRGAPYGPPPHGDTYPYHDGRGRSQHWEGRRSGPTNRLRPPKEDWRQRHRVGAGRQPHYKGGRPGSQPRGFMEAPAAGAPREGYRQDGGTSRQSSAVQRLRDMKEINVPFLVEAFGEVDISSECVASLGELLRNWRREAVSICTALAEAFSCATNSDTQLALFYVFNDLVHKERESFAGPGLNFLQRAGLVVDSSRFPPEIHNKYLQTIGLWKMRHIYGRYDCACILSWFDSGSQAAATEGTTNEEHNAEVEKQRWVFIMATGLIHILKALAGKAPPPDDPVPSSWGVHDWDAANTSSRAGTLVEHLTRHASLPSSNLETARGNLAGKDVSELRQLHQAFRETLEMELEELELVVRLLLNVQHLSDQNHIALLDIQKKHLEDNVSEGVTPSPDDDGAVAGIAGR